MDHKIIFYKIFQNGHGLIIFNNVNQTKKKKKVKVKKKKEVND